jgi:hypothetical protein
MSSITALSIYLLEVGNKISENISVKGFTISKNDSHPLNIMLLNEFGKNIEVVTCTLRLLA